MPSVTLTTGECAALHDHLSKSWADERLAPIMPRLQRGATVRQGAQAGKRFERRIAGELREIVASLPGEWRVSRNQTDRQKGQVGDGCGEYTIEGPQPFPWTFELKDGSGFRLQHLLTEPIPTPLSSTPKREGFWAQARRQAGIFRRFPILIVREPGDHRFEFAVMRPEHRAMLLSAQAVRATIVVDDDRLDVCFWATLRVVPGEKWLVPAPPTVLP